VAASPWSPDASQAEHLAGLIAYTDPGKLDILRRRSHLSRGGGRQLAKTLIDIDEDLLTRSQEILGTSTKKDTVNAALRQVTQRAAAEDFLAMAREGKLSDAADHDVIAQAWR
jgi:Arc/MetJ family transcription regulator